jgi:alanyl-tRNA synthetase
VVGITQDLTGKLHANDLVGAVSRKAGGGGGSKRPDFGTGQGRQPEQLEAALEHAYTVVREALAS